MTYKEIEVFSQRELDEIPVDFHGRILIKFGTQANKAIVDKRYPNSSVEARENSSVEAWENSSVVARGNSSVEAWENSSVVAWENSSVVAWENSSVEARGNSSVEGSGNAQIVDVEERGTVSVKGNARIVYNPKTPEEYAESYGLTCSDGYMRVFKAVRKCGDRYLSDRDNKFEYFIGETINADGLDVSRFNSCGKGIHAAHMAWCLDYGRDWRNLAILEIEMPMETMVVPVESGKVRADHCRVIREVPLEECGVYGKIIAKRKAAKE